MAEKQNSMKIRGAVSSGKGIGKKFVQLEWVQKQFEEKLGFRCYPGTLNLTLADREIRKREKLEKFKGIKIIPKNGYCEAKCFRAKIENFEEIKVALILPLVSNYPKNLIEIISPYNLRERLNLKDGDYLGLSVYPE